MHYKIDVEIINKFIFKDRNLFTDLFLVNMPV